MQWTNQPRCRNMSLRVANVIPQPVGWMKVPGIWDGRGCDWIIHCMEGLVGVIRRVGMGRASRTATEGDVGEIRVFGECITLSSLFVVYLTNVPIDYK